MQKADKLIFVTLFFSIFATITGVGIVVPLLPVYAHALGAGGLAIGLIFGAFSISRVLFLPYFGRLSDRKGRKPLIVPGLLAYTLVSFAFLFSDDVTILITVRFVQGIASAMLLPVIQAYVGDITPSGKEGITMGLFNMSVFIGLSLGPVLGGAINDRFGLDTAFLCMGALSFFGFLLSLVLLPPVSDEHVIRRGRPPARWKQLVMDPEVTGLFSFRFTYTLCIGVIWGFLPVLADAELSLSSAAIGFLVMLGILISGILHLPMGWVADRMDKKVLITAGGLLVSYAVYSYTHASSLGDMILASALFGVGGGFCMPALMATAVVAGEKNQAMGSVMALLTMAHSMGMLSGSMAAGAMMDLYQLRTAFPLGAVFMVVGTLTFLACTSRRRATEASPPSPKLPREPYTVYEEALGLHPVSEKTNQSEDSTKTP
jgi:MFS family permease